MPLLICLILAIVGCGFEPGVLAGDARRIDTSMGDTTAPGDVASDTTVPLDAQTAFYFEAETPNLTTPLDTIHSWTVETSLAGYSGSGYVTGLPTGAAACAIGNLLCGAASTYDFTVTVPGDYRITLRHHSDSNCCDSVYWSIGLNAGTEDLDPDSASAWTDDTTPTTVALTAGATSYVMRLREQATHVDSIRIELQ